MNMNSLENATVPVVLIEGDTPETSLVANVRRSARTRSNRERLRETMKGASERFADIRRDADKLDKQEAALDKSADLDAARRALVSSNADTLEELEKLRAVVVALEAEQEKAAPKIAALQEKRGELMEAAVDHVHEANARQLAFFIDSTSARDGDGPDAPLLPASVEFFRDRFSDDELNSFVAKVMGNLEGPLTMKPDTPA